MHTQQHSEVQGLWQMEARQILAELKQPGSSGLKENPLLAFIDEVPATSVTGNDLNNFPMNIFDSARLWEMFDRNDEQTVGQNLLRLVEEYNEVFNPREIMHHSFKMLSQTRAEFVIEVTEAATRVGLSFDTLGQTFKALKTPGQDPSERATQYNEFKEKLLLLYRELRQCGYTHNELVD